MMRVAPAIAAVILFAVPYQATPTAVVAGAGTLALLLAALGIVTLWRWPVTAAACTFLTAYALALWLAGPALRILGAVAFGLALLLLLQSLEVARCARRAVVDAGVVRSQLVAWTGLAATLLGTTVVVIVLARGMAGAIPFTVAPVIAAAGGLGVLLVLAAALTRIASRG